MSNLLQSISHFIRTVALLIVASLAAVGSWIGYDVLTRNARMAEDLKRSTAELEQNKVEIEKLHADVVAKNHEIERLDTALRLLKVDHRVAEIVVLDQWESDVEKRLKTKLAFRNVDDEGHMLDREAKVFTIDGDIVYVEGWIVKFEDALIETGEDPLRSTNLLLFQRLFGENQNPADGFRLDQVTARPAAYGGSGDMSKYEQNLWTHFWDLVTNPEAAKKAGVRAAHPEAPSMKLQPHKLYKLVLRASDGLGFELPQDMPADPAKDL